MKKKWMIRISSFTLFMMGVILLFSSQITITGAVTGTSSAGTGYFIGAVFIFVSVLTFAFSEQKKIKLRDVVNNNNFFAKEAKKACRDQYVKQDIKKLTRELGKGNFNAGSGCRSLGYNTGVHYMRTKNGGARLFFKHVGDTYEIIAKSSKKNENGVIHELKKKYH